MTGHVWTVAGPGEWLCPRCGTRAFSVCHPASGAMEDGLKHVVTWDGNSQTDVGNRSWEIMHALADCKLEIVRRVMES